MRRSHDTPGAAARGYSPEVLTVARSPFRPGRGVLPPLVAGRERELEIAERLLSDLARGRSSSEDLLFYGPRGNGKTTLLLEIRQRARERGMRAEALLTGALTSIERLVRALREEVGRFPGPGAGFHDAGFGATCAPAAPTADLRRLLVSWIAADPARPLVVVLDEIQALAPEVGRPFFDAVRQAKSGAAPFLVLTAGTPDAPRTLLRAGVSDGGGFRFLPVGRLARPDTVAALTVPTKESRRQMTEDAATLLAAESQDYPYFVQLLGSAAWEAAGTDSGISLQAAREGAAELRSRVRQFFSFRYREAEAHRVERILKPLALLFIEHEGHLPEARFEAFLDRFADGEETPFDAPALREKLCDLGVVWAERPGVWEMGIPSFADYLLRRA